MKKQGITRKGKEKKLNKISKMVREESSAPLAYYTAT